MKLNEEVVVAEFDGGRIILIVDNSRIINEHYVNAKDLHGKKDYLLKTDVETYDGNTGKTTFDYWLPMNYFFVSKKSGLDPLYLYKEIMEKYDLSYDCDINENQLLEIEKELDNYNIKDKRPKKFR